MFCFFFFSYLTILAELLCIVVAIANICVQHAQKSIIFVTHNCRPIYLFCVPQLSPPLLSENLGAGSFIALIFYLLNHHFSVPHLSLTVSNENHGTFIFTVQVLQKKVAFSCPTPHGEQGTTKSDLQGPTADFVAAPGRLG